MHYTDLRIYDISLKLVGEVYQLVEKIPFNWKIDEVDDIKRSSSSVPSNIVEGFGRRFYPRDFIRFLNLSLASSDETQTHLNKLFIKKLIKQSEFEYYFRVYKDLSIRILNYINYKKKKHNISI